MKKLAIIILVLLLTPASEIVAMQAGLQSARPAGKASLPPLERAPRATLEPEVFPQLFAAPERRGPIESGRFVRRLPEIGEERISEAGISPVSTPPTTSPRTPREQVKKVPRKKQQVFDALMADQMNDLSAVMKKNRTEKAMTEDVIASLHKEKGALLRELASDEAKLRELETQVADIFRLQGKFQVIAGESKQSRTLREAQRREEVFRTVQPQLHALGDAIAEVKGVLVVNTRKLAESNKALAQELEFLAKNEKTYQQYAKQARELLEMVKRK